MLGIYLRLTLAGVASLATALSVAEATASPWLGRVTLGIVFVAFFAADFFLWSSDPGGPLGGSAGGGGGKPA